MGDMGDLFRDYRAHIQEKRDRNLAHANPDGWTQHTEHHWSRNLNGNRLDYWPSRNKFRYQGQVMCGDVDRFIKKREVMKNNKSGDAANDQDRGQTETLHAGAA